MSGRLENGPENAERHGQSVFSVEGDTKKHFSVGISGKEVSKKGNQII